MAFVNTRDLIGDQATVDGLVEHSLTELKEDGIGIVETNACHQNAGLQSLELPSVSQIKISAFESCSNLEVVKLGGEGSSNSLSISSSAFANCAKLQHLIIDRPTKASLGNVAGLASTPIARGDGAIYVPNELLSAYKSDTVWKNFLIVDMTKYPLSAFESLADYSWTTILTNPDYATAYAVKDSKMMELTDGTKIKMDLAALDTDVKSDDSGTAKMTWLCHGIPYSHRMNANPTTEGGWAATEMRSWLISDVLSKIPTEIKSHIVSVKKSYRCKSPTDETLWSDDEIWIPSYTEVGLGGTAYESDGVSYSYLFGYTNNGRIKYNTSGSKSSWVVRTASNTSYFRLVDNAGSTSTVYGNTPSGVVFGFCTD